MRGGIVAIEIIIIITGLFLYFSTQNMLNTIQQQEENQPFWESLNPKDDNYYENYYIANEISSIGFILFIVGLIVCITGFIARKTKKEKLNH